MSCAYSRTLFPDRKQCVIEALTASNLIPSLSFCPNKAPALLPSRPSGVLSLALLSARQISPRLPSGCSGPLKTTPPMAMTPSTCPNAGSMRSRCSAVAPLRLVVLRPPRTLASVPLDSGIRPFALESGMSRVESWFSENNVEFVQSISSDVRNCVRGREAAGGPGITGHRTGAVPILHALPKLIADRVPPSRNACWLTRSGWIIPAVSSALTSDPTYGREYPLAPRRTLPGPSGARRTSASYHKR